MFYYTPDKDGKNWHCDVTDSVYSGDYDDRDEKRNVQNFYDYSKLEAQTTVTTFTERLLIDSLTLSRPQLAFP